MMFLLMDKLLNLNCLASLIRINAFLASAGLGSRRSVERHIVEGKVTVNGKVNRDLATRVDPKKDRVLCEGFPVFQLDLQYVMLNKPFGYTCTRKDPHAVKTIYDLLPSNMRLLTYAGRLDVDSEGLLLLSNDGHWIHQLTHPRYEMNKIYEVEIEGFPNQKCIEMACQGVRSRGELLKIKSVKFLKKLARSTVLQVVLHEGKNREIRRLWGALHHPVIYLKRVAIGTLKIGNLATGKWRKLSSEEIIHLKKD